MMAPVSNFENMRIISVNAMPKRGVEYTTDTMTRKP